jgi:signal peptidase I
MNQIKWREKSSKFWCDWAKPALTIVLLAGAFRSAIADWNDVPTGSMKPTILEGDRVFVNKLAYDLKIPFTTVHLTAWAHPKRGDIIVFFSPIDGVRLIKRVVGLPGDEIELRENQLLVNGQQATYGRLDEQISNQIRAEERPAYRFATEEIEQHRHPIMSAPQLSALRSFTALKVPADSYFVMGDNRDNSKDSRYIGCIPRGKIVGQAKAVVLSVDPGNHYLPRWGRFFSALP